MRKNDQIVVIAGAVSHSDDWRHRRSNLSRTREWDYNWGGCIANREHQHKKRLAKGVLPILPELVA